MGCSKTAFAIILGLCLTAHGARAVELSTIELTGQLNAVGRSTHTSDPTLLEQHTKANVEVTPAQLASPMAGRSEQLVSASQQGPDTTPDSGERPGHNVKPLWPLDGTDVAVMAIIMFSLSLAGGAGIGGGAILVPVFLMLRGWPTAIAVALSNVTILGGSLANFICNVHRHRPNGKRTIDWELILMMEPTTIAGALVGAVANKLLPNWFITYLLALLLTLMALRLYTKGKQTYAKETQLLQAAKAASKERALERQRSLVSSRMMTGSSPRLAEAGQRAGSATSDAVQVPGVQRKVERAHSYKEAFSRSLNRLRSGSLIVNLDPSILSPASGTAGASTVGSAGRQNRRGQSAFTPDVADDGGCREAAQDQDLPSPALEHYMRSTLFQGDADVDAGVVVALSASDDLSTVPSGDSADLEAGAAADQDAPELQQPLLTSSDRAAAADDMDDLTHGYDQSAAGRATSRRADAVKVREPRPTNTGQESPDLTVHLGEAEPSAKEPTQERSLPLPHFLTLLGLSAWVVAADILQDNFRCGSWQYWSTQLSVLVPVVTILAVFRHILLRKYRHDDLPEGHQLPDGELHWTKQTTVLYPLLCSTAGLIAGLFGIGGGVVKGPLMLELGVPADVAAATSATMIMFTAGSACLVYSRFGHILYDYAVVLVVLGFFITLCSQLLTFLLIKLLGRRSIIVFMMVALMAAATGIMYIQSGLVTADLVQHPEDWWHFGSICPAPHQGNLLRRLGEALLARLQ